MNQRDRSLARGHRGAAFVGGLLTTLLVVAAMPTATADDASTQESETNCTNPLGIYLACATATVWINSNGCVDGPGVDQKKCYYSAYYDCSGNGLGYWSVACSYSGVQKTDQYSCTLATYTCNWGTHSEYGYTIVYGCLPRTLVVSVTASTFAVGGSAHASASDSITWDFC